MERRGRVEVTFQIAIFFLTADRVRKKSFDFENILSASDYLQEKVEFQFLKQSIPPLFFESGVGS